MKHYVPNHHYVELEDEDGNTAKLPAIALARGDCALCKQTFYVASRLGAMTCPHCQGPVTWCWGHAQLAFVPEGESSIFSTFPPPAPGPHAVTTDLDEDDDTPVPVGIVPEDEN